MGADLFRREAGYLDDFAPFNHFRAQKIRQFGEREGISRAVKRTDPAFVAGWLCFHQHQECLT